MTDYTVKDFRDQTSPEVRDWRGMIRRVAISLTTGATWQVIGHLLLDGVTRETRPAEVFSGIGFFGRPPAGANAEGVLAFVGGAANPQLIATRDEDTRKKVANIDQNETAMFNSLAIATAKKDGTFEVRAAATPTVQPTLLGDTYRNAEDTMLNSLVAATDAIGAYATAIQGIVDPTNANTLTLLAKLVSFHAAASAFQSAGAAYLTAVLRAQ